MHRPTENENTKKSEEVQSDLLHDLPGWLQEFREKLVDESSPLEPRGNPAPKDQDTSSSFHELPMESRAQVDPGSGKHSIYIHFPKDPNCDICFRTKITMASCRRRAGTVVPRAENVSDLITADHKVLNEGRASRHNRRYAVVVQDLAKQWIQSYSCKTKTSQQTEKNLQKFLEPTRKPNFIYTDNSLEFDKFCEYLSWNHCTWTPHRSETNGIAERAVRRVKEGTSAVLLQSGLDKNWWAESMECYTYLRNIQDLLSDGKTPNERHFGEPFQGPIIPFGSLVEYYPISAKDQSRIHQFGKKVLPGLFLGYALYAEGIWKGDILVADSEELETMDASEINSKKTQCERGDTSQREWKIHFSSRRWTNHTFWRRSGTENTHIDTGTPNSRRKECHRDFLGESEGSLSPPQNSLPDAGEAIHDFWSTSGNFIYRHHVEPRVKLYSPREESFLVPLKYINVSRTTRTNKDVMQEKRIDDYWNIDVSLSLLFWKRNLQTDICGPGRERLTRKQLTARPDHSWPELWIKMGRNAKLKEWQKWSIEKPKLSNARRLRGIYFIDPEDKEFKETIKNARKKLETPMAPAMPCKTSKKSKHEETRGKTNEFKSKLACILEASESTRLRMEESLPNYHEDHIAG